MKLYVEDLMILTDTFDFITHVVKKKHIIITTASILDKDELQELIQLSLRDRKYGYEFSYMDTVRVIDDDKTLMYGDRVYFEFIYRRVE